MNPSTVQFQQLVPAHQQVDIDNLIYPSIKGQGFISPLGFTIVKAIHASHTKITDKMLQTIFNHCPYVEVLNAKGCMAITTAGFENFLLPATLKYIDVSDTAITNKGLHRIFACCPGLESLNVLACKAITKAGFATHLYPVTLQYILFQNENVSPKDLYTIMCQAQMNYFARIQDYLLVNSEFAKTPIGS